MNGRYPGDTNAGHGIEMDGVNYLMPVDARLERDVDVRFETVTVDDLLVSMSGASLRLLVLDACRNNPLGRSMRRTATIRSVSGGSFADLNKGLLGDEMLVAYGAAARTTTTAADGRGRNSPYTTALLCHLETPLEIELLFRRVRAQVLVSTNGGQRPARVPLAGGRALPGSGKMKRDEKAPRRLAHETPVGLPALRAVIDDDGCGSVGTSRSGRRRDRRRSPARFSTDWGRSPRLVRSPGWVPSRT